MRKMKKKRSIDYSTLQAKSNYNIWFGLGIEQSRSILEVFGIYREKKARAYVLIQTNG